MTSDADVSGRHAGGTHCQFSALEKPYADAVEGLTKSMACDLGAVGIRVNCVIPGWLMTERQMTLWLTPEAERMLMQAQCLKQKLTPADVARLVLFLASDDSRLCSAQLWVVDGGWM